MTRTSVEQGAPPSDGEVRTRIKVDKETQAEMEAIRDAIKALQIQQKEAVAIFLSLNQEAIEAGVDEKTLRHFEEQFGKIAEQIRKTAGELAKEIAGLDTEDKKLEKEIADLTETIAALRAVGPVVETIAFKKETEVGNKTEKQGGVIGKKKEKERQQEVLEKAVGRVERTAKKTAERRGKILETKTKMAALEKAGLPASAWVGVVSGATVDRVVDETIKDLKGFYEGLSDEEKRRFDSLKSREVPSIKKKRGAISGLKDLSDEDRKSVEEAINFEEAEFLKKDQREFVKGKKTVDAVVLAVVSGELTYKEVLSKIAETLDVAICNKVTLFRLPEELIQALIEKKFASNPFAEVAGAEFFETKPELWQKRVAWLQEKKKEIEVVANRDERGKLLGDLKTKLQERQRHDALKDASLKFNTGWDSTFPQNIDGLVHLCEGQIRHMEPAVRFLKILKGVLVSYAEIEACIKDETKIIEELRNVDALIDLEDLKRKRQPNEQDVVNLRARIEARRAIFNRPDVEKLIEDGRRSRERFEALQSEQLNSEFREVLQVLDQYSREMADRVLRDRPLRAEGSRLFVERFKTQVEAQEVVKRLEVQIAANNKYEEFKRTTMAKLVDDLRERAQREIVGEIENGFKKMDFLLQWREEIKIALRTPKKRFGFVGESQVSYRDFNVSTLTVSEQPKTVSVKVAGSELSAIEDSFKIKRSEVKVQMDRNFPAMSRSYALDANECFREFTQEVSNLIKHLYSYSGWETKIFNPVINEDTNKRRTPDEYFKPGSFYDMFPEVVTRLRGLEDQES